MFVGLTEGMDRRTVRRLVVQLMVTATVVALVFLVVGKLVFRLLGITVSDFMIASLVLAAIAVMFIRKGVLALISQS